MFKHSRRDNVVCKKEIIDTDIGNIEQLLRVHVFEERFVKIGLLCKVWRNRSLPAGVIG